jgi:hypothetical protein
VLTAITASAAAIITPSTSSASGSHRGTAQPGQPGGGFSLVALPLTAGSPGSACSTPEPERPRPGRVDAAPGATASHVNLMECACLI